MCYRWGVVEEYWCCLIAGNAAARMFVVIEAQQASGWQIREQQARLVRASQARPRSASKEGVLD